MEAGRNSKNAMGDKKMLKVKCQMLKEQDKRKKIF